MLFRRCCPAAGVDDIPVSGEKAVSNADCGLQVAATRAGGIPEFVRDGEDGYLARLGSAADFRRAVLDLIRDPQRALAMGSNARERIQETCSAAAVIPRELELLSGIAR